MKHKISLKRSFLYKTILLFFVVNIIFFALPIPIYADSEIERVDPNEMTGIFDTFKEIDREQAIELVNSGNIKSVGKNTSVLYFVDNDNNRYRISEDNADIESYLKLNGYTVNLFNIIPESNKDSGISYLAIMFFLAVFSFIAYKLIKQHMCTQKIKAVASGGVMNASGEIQKDVPTVKFSDVEGVEELKSDVMRIVDCLKNPQKYEAIGARTPKGVILYGPPGTGKTLLAKAIAGEAHVPFISAIGSDFIEKYVGVGASRVRDLYKHAKEVAPCIVFIDEIDAVASQRGADENSERDQTINALLAELDGFKSSEGIVTICATNRLDMLDSAFKRAGRFDLKLAVGLPDKDSRERILKIHAKNKTLDESVDLSSIALKTSGFSGADLEALLNEAAMVAVGKNKEAIDNDDISDAFFKIVMQGNKKQRKGISEMNRIVAWHEAGHTLATKLLTNDSVPSVTIIGSSSGAGGVTFRTPEHEGLQSKKYLKNLVRVMYAGRAAEEIYQNDPDMITNGASQDIKQATGIIKEYLALYGMGDIGLLDMTQLKNDFGDIVAEASKLSKEIYDSTLKILTENKEALENLANNLLEKETLDEKEIDEIIKQSHPKYFK